MATTCFPRTAAPMSEERVPFTFRCPSGLRTEGEASAVVAFLSAVMRENSGGIVLRRPVASSLGSYTRRIDGSVLLEDRPGMTHGLDFADCRIAGRKLGRCRVTYYTLREFEDGHYTYFATLWPQRHW